VSAHERRLQNLCRCGSPRDGEQWQSVSTDCATLQEAVIAWQRLTPEQKIRATARVIGGPVYAAQQIAQLQCGPKLA
jgi:hypothetical protein